MNAGRPVTPPRAPMANAGGTGSVPPTAATAAAKNNKK